MFVAWRLAAVLCLLFASFAPAVAQTPAAIPLPNAGLPLGRLAYVQAGDVWYRDLPDGDPHRLTTDGVNGDPLWSRSGEWLAFRGEQGVLLKRLDWPQDRSYALDAGNPIGAVAWSPTDDRLAFVTSAGDLWVLDAARLGPVLSENVPHLKVRPAPVGRIAWSPDGQWLAYDATRVLKEKENQPPDRYAGLWRVRSDGTDAAEVYSTGSPAEDGILLAGWTPDGQSLLARPDPMFSASILADGVPLVAIPTSGGQPTELSNGMLLPPDFLALAPVGNMVAVAAGGGRETWRNKYIQTIDLSTGNRRRLTEDSVAAVSPAWAPDASRLAFVAAPSLPDTAGGEEARVGLAKRRIWIVNQDGSGKQALTIDPVYRDEAPSWSADGRHILFARLDSEGRATLWLIPAGRVEPKQVVDELSPIADWFGYYGYLDWSTLFDWWRPAPTVSTNFGG